jgi:transmembrane sensor
MTRNSQIASRSDDLVLNTAASWFDRLQNEELSAEDLASWQRWLAESSAHQRAFDELQDVWQRLEGLQPPQLPDGNELMADRFMGDVSVGEWNLSQAAPANTGAAARTQPAPVRQWMRPLTIAAAVAVLMVGVYVLRPLWTSIWSSPLSAVYETRGAQHSEVRLPDGSLLSLGAKSLAWINFGAERRDVVLERGEAFFKVARDSRRAFVVRAGDTQITAVGTAFNVRRAGERVMVAVEEGAVNVSPTVTRIQHQAEPRRVSAGEQVTLERDARSAGNGATLPLTAAAASWRTGRLEYLNEPLKYVVADVNRYSKTEVLIEDPAVAELLVTGTVFEDDIDGWLRSIEEFMPVTADRSDGERVRLRGR